ncbi:MAG: cellulose biosynthesis protein BcsS, partial [Xanthobacteraceae bacterium]
GVCPVAADMLEDAPEEPTFLYFSGVDLWREGGFLHGGVLWSPDGLDQDGFTLKFIFGSGAYRYLSGALGDAEVVGHQLSGSAMPGWRFKRPGFEMTVFAGLDAQDHRLSPDDPSSDLRGSHVGLRSGFDLWYEPNRTTMLAADASVSTIGTSYNAHAAYGWRLFNRVYVGPEAAAFASDDYRQYRFGLHATAFKTGTIELSAGAGYARDSSHRSGAYGRLSLVTRR